MLARCYNPKNQSFKNYGGRGIEVCKEWRDSFDTFERDMGRPEKAMEIDRIDNFGHYCKENCRWATKKQQGRNRRNNHRYTLGDRLLTLSEAAEEFGWVLSSLQSRIQLQGLTLEEALNKPYKPNLKKRKNKENPDGYQDFL